MRDEGHQPNARPHSTRGSAYQALLLAVAVLLLPFLLLFYRNGYYNGYYGEGPAHFWRTVPYGALLVYLGAGCILFGLRRSYRFKRLLFEHGSTWDVVLVLLGLLLFTQGFDTFGWLNDFGLFVFVTAPPASLVGLATLLLFLRRPRTDAVAQPRPAAPPPPNFQTAAPTIRDTSVLPLPRKKFRGPVKDPLDQEVINYKRLEREVSDWRNLELDYRTHPQTTRWETVHALMNVAVLSLLALLAMFVIRLFGSYFFTLPAILFVSSLGILCAFVLYARRKAVLLALLAVFAGPFVSLALGSLHYVTATASLNVVLMLASLAFAAWVVDRLTVHYAHWLLANPRLSRPVRFCRLAWYRSRWLPLAAFGSVPAGSPSAAPDLERRRRAEIRRLRAYPLGLAVLALYAVVPLIEPRDYPDVFLLLVPFLFALARLVWTAPHLRVDSAFRTSLLALRSWFTYGAGGTDAPGVFRSPAGRLSRRTAATAVLFAFVALSVCPSVRYFSFVQETAGSEDVWSIALGRSLAQAGSLSSLFYTPTEESPTAEFQEPVRQWYQDNREKVHYAPYGSEYAERGYAQVDENISRWERKQYADFRDRQPAAWILVALDGLSRGETRFLTPLLLAFFLCLTFPVLVFWSILASLSAGALTHTRLAVETPDAPECGHPGTEPPTPWEDRVARLRSSVAPNEAQHLWIGSHYDYDYPVLLDRKILEEHAYIVGDSGSGKTVLGITPLLTQIIRAGDAAVVVLDLKGDNSLFQTVREEAGKAGRTFKFFTNELGKPTYTFNPFLQVNNDHISLNQVCETILEALNLNHGEGYGRSYFSRVARHWLSSVLTKFPHIDSFKHLYELAAAAENFGPREQQDAFELIAVIESLASFTQLNIAPKTGPEFASALEHAIHMPDVIAERQVVYFWLPAAIETASVREIAKLALYSLLNSAYWNLRRQGETAQPSSRGEHKRAQTFLVIDEFQRIASDNFKIVLEQARSMGVGAILANQTFADLKTPDTDLRPTVQTNTRFKQTFSATDLDQQLALMTGSGECIRYRYSWSHSDRGTTVSVSETMTPRLLRNDVIAMSDDPLGSVVHVARGSGYAQFTGYMLRTAVSHTVTKDRYDKLSGLPWPEASPETITVHRKPLDVYAHAGVQDRLEAGKRVIRDGPSKPKPLTEPLFEEESSSPSSQMNWVTEVNRLAELYATPE